MKSWYSNGPQSIFVEDSLEDENKFYLTHFIGSVNDSENIFTYIFIGSHFRLLEFLDLSGYEEYSEI